VALEERRPVELPKAADYGPEQFLVLITCRGRSGFEARGSSTGG
jgi:hypothetical protein